MPTEDIITIHFFNTWPSDKQHSFPDVTNYLGETKMPFARFESIGVFRMNERLYAPVGMFWDVVASILVVFVQEDESSVKVSGAKSIAVPLAT